MRGESSINIRRFITLPGMWSLLAVVLATLATLLTVAVIADPQPSQDLKVMNWITGWDLPGLAGFFSVVSALTSLEAGLVYGVLGVEWPLHDPATENGLGVRICGRDRCDSVLHRRLHFG